LLLAPRQLVREAVGPPPRPTLSRIATGSASLRRAASAPNWTFSLAVNPGKMLNAWNTKLTVWRRKAKRSRRDARLMSVPFTRTVPSVEVSRAPMRFSSVVLPDPDGPSTTTNSPGSTRRSTSSSAVTATMPSPNRLDTPVNSIIVIGPFAFPTTPR
jgi:hypothetical protein